MTRYLIRQALLSLVKLFIFVSLMFFLIQIMIPGDFVDQFSLSLDTSQREELRVQMGLDLPVWQRYISWLVRLATLDFGTSFYGEPVIELMKTIVPPTLLVFFTGTVLAFMIGMWLGKRTAWHGNGCLSRLATLGGITLFTSFPPFLAFLLAFIFTRGRSFYIMGEVGGLRGASYTGLDSEIWRQVDVDPSLIVTRMVLTLLACTLLFLLFNTLLSRLVGRGMPAILLLALISVASIGIWFMQDMQALAFDILKLSWLAILTYTLLSFGETMLIMQSSMTDVLKEQYIDTARAKGLSASTVREKHAARNALLPVLSRFVISLPYLLTAAVIIESSVGWPGMGTTMWNALYWQNMPVVMAILVLIGILSLIARLVLDVVIAFSDPRIRYDQQPSVA